MIKTQDGKISDKLQKGGGKCIEVKGIKTGSLIMRQVCSILIDTSKAKLLLSEEELKKVEIVKDPEIKKPVPVKPVVKETVSDEPVETDEDVPEIDLSK